MLFFVCFRGQQLAQQMQQQNPELVEQLRSQMGRPPTGENPSSQQPPNPDGTSPEGMGVGEGKK